jgi:SCY1-like protein 1
MDASPNSSREYSQLLQEDSSNCSIFSFDITANKARLPLARNAVKKLRTLRHPGVVKVLDTVEVGCTV